MSEQLIPIQFRSSATHYCKYCNVWGITDYPEDYCGNCGQQGYLMKNPFPDNLVPYYVIEPVTEADRLRKLGEVRPNVSLKSELGQAEQEDIDNA